MKKYVFLCLFVGVSVLSFCVTPTFAADAKYYMVVLLPVNNSRTVGLAQVRLKDDQLWVRIRAWGFTPNQQYQQGIYGFSDKKGAQCPSSANDLHNDGTITSDEASITTGSMLMNLSPNSDINQSGAIIFEQVYTVNQNSFKQLNTKVLMLQGMIQNRSLPISCGAVQEIPFGGPFTSSSVPIAPAQQAPDTGSSLLN